MEIFLNQNIRTLRRQNGWSQEQLAEELKLNRGNIASYEKGSAQPKLCNVLKIAGIFGVSVRSLLLENLAANENPCHSAVPTLLSEEDQKDVERITEHHQELRSYIESVHRCQQFKLRKLEGQPSREVQHLIQNYEQLYEATQLLLLEQETLLRLLAPPSNGQD